MMQMVTLEPTKINIEYVEKVMDLCSDYELGFLTDDEFEAELEKINGGRK